MPPETLPSRRRVAARFALRMSAGMVGSNVVGAFAVYVFLAWVLPDSPESARLEVVNTVVFLAYLGASTLFGTLGSVLLTRRLLRWFRAGHVLGDEDRRLTLRLPARCVRLYAAIWGVGVVVFFTINVGSDPARAFDVVATTALGGITTCALCYLLAERAVRPLVAEAMRDQEQPPPVVLGVRRRILLAWLLGTGVPVLGIVLGSLDPAGNGALTRGPVAFLGLLALAVGLLAMLVAARSVSDPVEAVTRALAAVGAGDLDTRVTVDDVSELGQLQTGVNAMVAGLRERERLRDLYGRQVGADVAELTAATGVRLGGELRTVGVLFVDVIGSTALTREVGPDEVVARLNAFFGVVVDVVTRAGGWVNKFEGDATLCVFGAPAALPDAAAASLTAARELRDALAPLPLQAAVGVAYGEVVAGHVGSEQRFEYTVVGDAVNTAARLSEQAKAVKGCVLASAATVEAARGAERTRWLPAGAQVLRGHDAPTPVSRPT